MCLSKDIARYFLASYDTIYMHKAVKSKLRSSSKCNGYPQYQRRDANLGEALNDPKFLEHLTDDENKQAIYYLAALLNLGRMGFMYFESWEAVSYDYILYERVRAITEEEKVRIELRKWCMLGGAIFVFQVLNCLIMEARGLNENQIHRVPVPSSSADGKVVGEAAFAPKIRTGEIWKAGMARVASG